MILILSAFFLISIEIAISRKLPKADEAQEPNRTHLNESFTSIVYGSYSETLEKKINTMEHSNCNFLCNQDSCVEGFCISCNNSDDLVIEIEISSFYKLCKCKKGYFLDIKKGKCSKCGENCLDCSLDGKICIQCENTSILIVDISDPQKCRCENDGYFSDDMCIGKHQFRQNLL